MIVSSSVDMLSQPSMVTDESTKYPDDEYKLLFQLYWSHDSSVSDKLNIEFTVKFSVIILSHPLMVCSVSSYDPLAV